MNELPKEEQIELSLVKKLVMIDPTESPTRSDEEPIDSTEVKEVKTVTTAEPAEETTNPHGTTLVGIPFDPGGSTFDPGGSPLDTE